MRFVQSCENVHKFTDARNLPTKGTKPNFLSSASPYIQNRQFMSCSSAMRRLEENRLMGQKGPPNPHDRRPKTQTGAARRHVMSDFLFRFCAREFTADG